MYIERQQNDAVGNLIGHTKTMANDILNIYQIINSSHRTSDSVKKAQSDILINSYCKNKIIFHDRITYFRITSIIIKVGTITNDANRVQTTFNDLNTLIALIFSKDITFEEKYELLNNIGFNYEMVCNEYLQSSKTTDDLKIFYQNMNNCFDDALELISNADNIEESKVLVKNYVIA